jgi:hypothetical protein
VIPADEHPSSTSPPICGTTPTPADCSDPETARRVHQIRDTVVRVGDPSGGGIGVGNWQPMITGAFPELGLTADTSFT